MKKSRREKRKQRIEDKIFRTKSQNSVLNNDQILEQKAVRKTPNSKQHNNPFLYSFFCFLFAIIFYFIPVMAINHFVFLVLMVIAAYFVFVAKSELMSRWIWITFALIAIVFLFNFFEYFLFSDIVIFALMPIFFSFLGCLSSLFGYFCD